MSNSKLLSHEMPYPPRPYVPASLLVMCSVVVCLHLVLKGYAESRDLECAGVCIACVSGGSWIFLHVKFQAQPVFLRLRQGCVVCFACALAMGCVALMGEMTLRQVDETGTLLEQTPCLHLSCPFWAILTKQQRDGSARLAC